VRACVAPVCNFKSEVEVVTHNGRLKACWGSVNEVTFRKYKKNNIWILLLGFLIAALQVFSAIIHTFAINELIKSKVINFLLWNILSLSLWGLLFILNYFKGIFEEKITQKISADIREDLANRISTTTYENFINNFCILV